MKARRDVYQAIADPTRRAIIRLIAAEPLDIKSLTEKFDMSQQAISLHVKLLADCGLVRMEQRGRNRFCRPKLDKLEEETNGAVLLAPIAEAGETPASQNGLDHTGETPIDADSPDPDPAE